MEQKRLFFIDAIRAWAIVMMLQGHFIDGLLDPVFRDPNNLLFKIWLYFRGVTAPVFFTASGLIFTYLLFKEQNLTYRKKRLRKGLKRVAQLLALGYLLRLDLNGLFKGELYPSFFYVDVLHCIGISLLVIIFIYYAVGRWSSWGFGAVCILTSLIVFVMQPQYSTTSYPNLPLLFSQYLTTANGSVFTIIPWLGYSTFGAFIALIFLKFKDHAYFYSGSIAAFILVGFLLKFSSTSFFISLNNTFEWPIFKAVANNNYLFNRLGDVFWVMAIFMGARSLIKNPIFLTIGQNTLSIYVIHSIILYGSSFGVGLYRFHKQSLSPEMAVSGALVFIIISVSLSFLYVKTAVWRKDVFSTIFTKKINHE